MKLTKKNRKIVVSQLEAGQAIANRLATENPGFEDYILGEYASIISKLKSEKVVYTGAFQANFDGWKETCQRIQGGFYRSIDWKEGGSTLHHATISWLATTLVISEKRALNNQRINNNLKNKHAQPRHTE